MEYYILPLIIQALNGNGLCMQSHRIDSDEFVIERALACLKSLTELGLLSKSRICTLIGYASPLLLHPNRWIRNGIVHRL
jgi:hypothetical protein